MFYVSALRILIITLASDKFVTYVLISRENKVLTSPQMIYMKYQIVFSQKKKKKKKTKKNILKYPQTAKMVNKIWQIMG